MNNVAKGPIWFGVALVVIIAATVGWIYFIAPSGGNLNIGVALSTSTSNVLLGEPFTLSVALTNNSGSALASATIALVLPQNVVSVDEPNERVVTQPVGDVSAGGVSNEVFNLVATGGANTVAHFTADLTYGTSGSSAQFENNGSLDLPLGESAVGLNITAPSDVVSGQSFPITVAYDNTADEAIQNLTLAMQYPPAFVFAKASSSLATNGNSSWSLGTLAPNATGTITVTGNLVGANNASYPIGAMLSENVGGQSYTIESPAANVVLSQSPITFGVSVDNSQSYVSTTGDTLQYVLSFTNNAQVTFQNITINANLVGGMYDFSSLVTDGAFNSVADSISWNGASSPALLSLAPGQSGSVSFRIHTKSAFPIRLLSDKNYSLAVNARLASPTVPPGTDASSTISVSSLTTKLGGNISLAMTGYHRDPLSVATLGFPANTGPYPPKVNEPTQYTIHWSVTNYATDADNVTISAYLQSGTTCTGAMDIPASTTLSCNPSSGQMTWTIPIVSATTGIVDAPLQAVFQVTNTPAINELNQDITLIGPATLAATDGFTGLPLQASAGAVTTALPNDTSVGTGQRQVSQ